MIDEPQCDGFLYLGSDQLLIKPEEFKGGHSKYDQYWGGQSGDLQASGL